MKYVIELDGQLYGTFDSRLEAENHRYLGGIVGGKVLEVHETWIMDQGKVHKEQTDAINDIRKAMEGDDPEGFAKEQGRQALESGHKAADARNRGPLCEPCGETKRGNTTDPNDPCIKQIKPGGQQACYLVLSEEERKKGFVRPVRRSYVHVGIAGPKYALRDLTEEEKDWWKDDSDPFVKFEEYPEELKAQGRTGKYWTQKQLDSVGKGCGSTTSMGQAIAETYARQPSFYSGTMCVHCGRHFPVGEDGEFIWLDDGTRVGT